MPGTGRAGHADQTLERQYPTLIRRISVRCESYSLRGRLWAIFDRLCSCCWHQLSFVLLIACVNVAVYCWLVPQPDKKKRWPFVRRSEQRLRSTQQLLTKVCCCHRRWSAWARFRVLEPRFHHCASAATVPRMKEVKLDAWVFGFTLTASAFADVCGLAPHSRSQNLTSRKG